jgi:flagellar motor switch protein FliN/FliY
MGTALEVSPTPAAAGAEAAAAGVEEEARWQRVLALPCLLTVDLPLPDFTIADLLKLRVGSVVNAHWRIARDVPLRLNGTMLGLTEFEVVGENLAVRLTELE